MEFANAADDRDDIIDDGLWNGSIDAGTPSNPDPIYLGWGWNEEDSGVDFVRIGQIF